MTSNGMNQVNNESKSSAIKALAIVGFVVLIIFCVWLAIQAVRVVPSTFSSLASIAETISDRPAEELEISTGKTIVNAGEAFTVTWTDLEREGTYSFGYACTDGVSLEVRLGNDDVRELSCQEDIVLPDTTTSIDVMIESEKRRFVEVPYHLTFSTLGESETSFANDTKITVVNATIPQSAVLAENSDDDEMDEEHEVTHEETTTPTVSTSPTTPTPAPQPRPINYTYIPTSDPNGFTDLQVAFIGAGRLSGNNFIPTSPIDNDSRGGLRFEVKNIGTKTSESWRFEAKLPNGATFKSDRQNGLKPNERSVITLGFDLGDTEGTEQIRVSVDVDDDRATSNNALNWSVQVVD